MGPGTTGFVLSTYKLKFSLLTRSCAHAFTNGLGKVRFRLGDFDFIRILMEYIEKHVKSHTRKSSIISPIRRGFGSEMSVPRLAGPK